MRRRLRDLPDRAELDRLYAAPHDHTRWGDHKIRVDVTVALARHFVGPHAIVADLSCGDAAIAKRLPCGRLILGDYAPGYELTGPIEQTILTLHDLQADLFICSETLEHLDDPDSVLVELRKRARALVVSTPDGELDDSNPEHLWAWDAEAVEQMLEAAGWRPQVHLNLDPQRAGFRYQYQIWGCQ